MNKTIKLSLMGITMLLGSLSLAMPLQCRQYVCSVKLSDDDTKYNLVMDGNVIANFYGDQDGEDSAQAAGKKLEAKGACVYIGLTDK